MLHKIATTFGIAYRCPFGTRQQACPMMDTGMLPLKDRYDIITNLPTKNLNEILEFHKNCSCKREEIQPPPSTNV